MVAKLTGHEAAVFGPTGTMMNQANLKAIRTHLQAPPYSVICDHRAHVYKYEASGIAFHSRANTVPVIPSGSYLTLKDVQDHLVLDDDFHCAPTRLICLENTLNGQVFPITNMTEISKLSRQNNIPLHLDGARLWNACVKTGVSMETYCSLFDSISLCLSKGLGAPIGSILVGNKKFIRKAIAYRKLFGGGWRQAGFLAAAAHYAIENNWSRMSEDHSNATYLETHLKALGFKIFIPTETNMVWIDTSSIMIPCGSSLRPLTMGDLEQELFKEGIAIFGGKTVRGRLVLHLGINREGVNALIQSIRLALLTLKSQIL